MTALSLSMLVEIVGGLFLIVGFLTRISAILLACVVVTVLFTAKAGGSITGGDRMGWSSE